MQHIYINLDKSEWNYLKSVAMLNEMTVREQVQAILRAWIAQQKQGLSTNSVNPDQN